MVINHNMKRTVVLIVIVSSGNIHMWKTLDPWDLVSMWPV